MHFNGTILNVVKIQNANNIDSNVMTNCRRCRRFICLKNVSLGLAITRLFRCEMRIDAGW